MLINYFIKNSNKKKKTNYINYIKLFFFKTFDLISLNFFMSRVHTVILPKIKFKKKNKKNSISLSYVYLNNRYILYKQNLNLKLRFFKSYRKLNNINSVINSLNNKLNSLFF